MVGVAARRALLLAGLLAVGQCSTTRTAAPVPQGTCQSDALAPAPVPQIVHRGIRVQGGQALKQRSIHVDSKCYDETLNQEVDKEQDYPGFALEMNHGGNRLSFEVVPIKGGLVQAYKLNGTNILLNKPKPDEMDGSMFWPSPQSDWGWPPPAQIDPVPSKDFRQVYAVEVDRLQGLVTLASPVAPKLGVSVRKSFSAVPELGAVLLNYELINAGKKPRSFAPWEITRVPSNGLSFFATGTEQPTSGTWRPLPVENVAGATWFQQDPARNGGGKLYVDAAKGWLAHVSGELLLVKCFQKVQGGPTAPGEKQIELYDGGDYVELELQGPYVSIAPGGSLSWKVMWYLRYLPPAKRDKPSLVALADGLCSDPLRADSTAARW